MGMEYQAEFSGTVPDWPQIEELFQALPGVRVTARGERSLCFVFSDLNRDRSQWAEDGVLDFSSTGPIPGRLYLLCHVGNPTELLQKLEHALEEAGYPVTFSEL